MEPKNTKQKILEKVLCFMAKSLLKKHNPCIIGITGSIGKTSTKDAIYHILKDHYNTVKTQKNYNNEIGLPLTIIGAETGGTSPAGWARVCMKWISQMRNSDYPEVLVLEFGIDHPGDMDKLVEIAKPDIALVTAVAHSHEMFFPDAAAIAHEKGKIIDAMRKGTKQRSAAILNGDDKVVRKMKNRTKAPIFTYGFHEDLDVHALHVTENTTSEGSGITFKVEAEGRSVPVRVPNLVGKHSLYAILGAISVAQIFKINLVDIAQSLLTFTLPPGRMRLLPGKNKTVLLDDSYNASSPASVNAAIKTLATGKKNRTVAVLGDMLELGDKEKDYHKEVGKCVQKEKIDFVVTVGSRMAYIEEVLSKENYTLGENLFLVDKPQEAIEILLNTLKPDDYILIKGSQGMRLEVISEALLASNINPKEVLCRQDASWKAKSFSVQ